METNRLHQVRVEKVHFAAAHFATTGETCEPLHGHTYEVATEVEGTLSPDAWVVDFIELKAILRGLCESLDHRFLLQRQSNVLQIEECDSEWRVKTAAGDAYAMPAADVIALPIDNSTAERLSQWLCGRVAEALSERGATNIRAVTVEVWEGPDQRASFRQERLPLG